MAEVTAVNRKKRSQGWEAMVSQKVRTSAMEHPMMSRPPMSSPQRMLDSSMKCLRISEKGLRGSAGGGSGAMGAATLRGGRGGGKKVGATCATGSGGGIGGGAIVEIFWRDSTVR